MNFFTLNKSIFSFIKKPNRCEGAISFNNKYIFEIRRISEFDTLLGKTAVNLVFNLINGEVKKLTEELKKRVLNKVDELNDDGLRVIAIAQKSNPSPVGAFGVKDECDMVMM